MTRYVIGLGSQRTLPHKDALFSMLAREYPKYFFI
jgi:hypothetical protein